MIKKILLAVTLVLSSLMSNAQQPIYKDVAPIFYSRCASCHHQGSQYPPLNYYSSISGFTGIINNYISIGKMPPWPPDTTYARFTHERIITQSEKIKF